MSATTRVGHAWERTPVRGSLKQTRARLSRRPHASVPCPSAAPHAARLLSLPLHGAPANQIGIRLSISTEPDVCMHPPCISMSPRQCAAASPCCGHRMSATCRTWEPWHQKVGRARAGATGFPAVHGIRQCHDHNSERAGTTPGGHACHHATATSTSHGTRSPAP